MAARVVVLFVALSLLLAGCGGGAKHAPTTTRTTPKAAPRFTSPVDLQECANLESNLTTISQLVSSVVEYMTQSLHPKELAKRTGQARLDLLVSAKAFQGLGAPKRLVAARNELAGGLREYAADFAVAQKAVQHKNLAKASAALADEDALGKLKAATHAIDRACKG